jgi:hypothetical protein
VNASLTARVSLLFALQNLGESVAKIAQYFAINNRVLGEHFGLVPCGEGRQRANVGVKGIAIQLEVNLPLALAAIIFLAVVIYA